MVTGFDHSGFVLWICFGFWFSCFGFGCGSLYCKSDQSGGFILKDVEHRVQLGNLEHDANLGRHAANLQLPAAATQFFVKRDELSQRRAGEKFDRRQIQQNLAMAVFLHQLEQLAAHEVRGRLVEHVVDRESPA